MPDSTFVTRDVALVDWCRIPDERLRNLIQQIIGTDFGVQQESCFAYRTLYEIDYWFEPGAEPDCWKPYEDRVKLLDGFAKTWNLNPDNIWVRVWW